MKYLNTLTFAFELSEVDDTMNGYKNSEFNLLKELDNKWIEFIYSNDIPLKIGYNNFTKKNYVYVGMSFTNLVQEQIDELKKLTSEIVTKLDLKALFPTIEKELTITTTDGIAFIDKVSLEGFIPTRILFSSVEDIKLYERFSKSKIIRKHIDAVQTFAGLGKPESTTPYEKLRIHDIELTSNTLLLHHKVAPLFRIFKIANEYLLKFDNGKIEFELGKLMLANIEFGEFVISQLVSLKEDSDLNKMTAKLIKKAQSTISKKKVSEEQYAALEEDLVELFGLVLVV